MSEHKGLPVHGYQPQSDEVVSRVNANKIYEEHILRIIDALAVSATCDPRWLGIARIHIEQGFMAMNRAIFKPTRIDLD